MASYSECMNDKGKRYEDLRKKEDPGWAKTKDDRFLKLINESTPEKLKEVVDKIDLEGHGFARRTKYVLGMRAGALEPDSDEDWDWKSEGGRGRNGERADGLDHS